MLDSTTHKRNHHYTTSIQHLKLLVELVLDMLLEPQWPNGQESDNYRIHTSESCLFLV